MKPPSQEVVSLRAEDTETRTQNPETERERGVERRATSFAVCGKTIGKDKWNETRNEIVIDGSGDGHSHCNYGVGVMRRSDKNTIGEGEANASRRPIHGGR